MPATNTTNTLKQLLPELQQIEAMIHLGDRAGLSSQVLCHVSCDDGILPIYAITLGNRARTIPCITYVAGVHGLERIGTQVVIAFLEALLERLKWDQVLSDILQRVCINFLPLINPVGMLNYTRANGQGVDLMRNAPVDSHEKTIWLAGGHRISSYLPWYRGKASEGMQPEAQALCDFITREVFSAPFSLVLDCHSGFGTRNQIWFPYARSRLEPIKHLKEVFYLRKLFMQTYPYQDYLFEPQSQHYLVHGDLWDFLYLKSLASDHIFLPLTLEMGSWRWIRKNPLQLRQLQGLYHPIKPHRLNRVLRGHLILMEFLLHATLSYENWLIKSDSLELEQQARALWYT
ncbi:MULTISPECIES: M14 family zinc carboxypeptidase [Nitrosomonas]|uniref:Zinc carboxypeptidase n=1 Tax=Nitrosomonas communis TaxID=44574 RepID=A0A0F7KH85_9PROT|nr:MULTISPECIES: M14 family zinc carboxypeptidase [Nitrosomonas]AKH38861.1 zinc carboxypeptidase [Nitrosomonas communis]TYP88253.1 zinc carboxypeptidase [Nitrosomonas communis]UVS60985.1 M14 family zinc carboxypeptidase [Nitrosomonas sp. PLL12]